MIKIRLHAVIKYLMPIDKGNIDESKYYTNQDSVELNHTGVFNTLNK